MSVKNTFANIYIMGIILIRNSRIDNFPKLIELKDKKQFWNYSEKLFTY